jgi:hypothetical protein
VSRLQWFGGKKEGGSPWLKTQRERTTLTLTTARSVHAVMGMAPFPFPWAIRTVPAVKAQDVYWSLSVNAAVIRASVMC